MQERFFDKWLENEEKWLVFFESGSQISNVDRIILIWLEIHGKWLVFIIHSGRRTCLADTSVTFIRYSQFPAQIL